MMPVLSLTNEELEWLHTLIEGVSEVARESGEGLDADELDWLIKDTSSNDADLSNYQVELLTGLLDGSETAGDVPRELLSIRAKLNSPDFVMSLQLTPDGKAHLLHDISAADPYTLREAIAESIHQDIEGFTEHQKKTIYAYLADIDLYCKEAAEDQA
jgi:hypothetical protein